ncbi:MAG: 2-isopropylmalate synthase [Oscillospiraceae bacterium]
MKQAGKYQTGFYNPPTCTMEWAKKDHIEKAPVWCSVDLRDGNQALIIPMSLEEKLEFFQVLVNVDFKEIEVGFPAASETEYEFLRTLIDQNLIPDDVTIQVLTQSRQHIIQKTFDALKGVKKAIVHLYNSTSVAQRQQVFRKSRAEIIDIAVEGAKFCKECAAQSESDIRFEYSPESFTGTEMEFARDICNAVLDIWQPTADRKVIINLPVTVSMSMSHVYANQIEYMCSNLKYRENVVVSLHPHNDRGCGVADAEMGLLAGGDRIEGTLFGNGERTGNVDIITLALNMYSQGIEPGLDFTNIPAITEVYERVTRMHVYERQPYSGALVFAAFSGSHQDAIAKGMKWREENDTMTWTVPYLPIDPQDLGREYESDVIRINSQSGKGGIGYLLEQKFGFDLPPKMREAVGYTVKNVSDHSHKELMPDEVCAAFKDNYVDVTGPVNVTEVHYQQKDGIYATVTVEEAGKTTEYVANGNGRLDAVKHAMEKVVGESFNILTYKEHAQETGSTSKAVAYVGITWDNNGITWGAGIHEDIMTASVRALVSAINNHKK